MTITNELFTVAWYIS